MRRTGLSTSRPGRFIVAPQPFVLLRFLIATSKHRNRSACTGSGRCGQDSRSGSWCRVLRAQADRDGAVASSSPGTPSCPFRPSCRDETPCAGPSRGSRNRTPGHRRSSSRPASVLTSRRKMRSSCCASFVGGKSTGRSSGATGLLGFVVTGAVATKSPARGRACLWACPVGQLGGLDCRCRNCQAVGGAPSGSPSFTIFTKTPLILRISADSR